MQQANIGNFKIRGNKIVVDESSDSDKDYAIGDFIPSYTESTSSENGFNKTFMGFQSYCLLPIQLCVLIFIATQLYVTLWPPDYNSVGNSLSNIQNDNEKTYDVENGKFIYQYLMDMKRHVVELENEIVYLRQFVNTTEYWQNSVEDRLAAMNKIDDPKQLQMDVNDQIRKALIQYDADKVGTIDYALKSMGGSILSTPGTQPYTKPGEFNLFGILRFDTYSDPNLLIRSSSLPGDCFAFHGSKGNIRIRLARKIIVTNFTIEHVNSVIADDVSSAPKEMSVYASDDDRFTSTRHLANYVYDIDNNSVQTFAAYNNTKVAYEFIELRILSNYGNKDYTCVYRFRVHGHKIGN